MSCQTESTFALENTQDAERAKPAWPVASPRQHFEITQGKKRGEQLGAFQHLLGALLTDLGPWSVRLPDGREGENCFYNRKVSREFWHFQLPRAAAAVIGVRINRLTRG